MKEIFKKLFIRFQLLLFKTLKVGQKRYTRFIVLSHSRSGSNLLLSLLNTNPSIEAKGEIMVRLKDKDPKILLNTFFSEKRPLYIKVRGFKVFYYHPLDGEQDEFWSLLKKVDDLHILHLKRKNLLRTLTSLKIAFKTDKWKSFVSEMPDPLSLKKVSFTTEELIQKFEMIRHWEQKSKHYFNEQKYLSIDYEDLVNHRDDTIERVTEFLGTDFVKPSTNLRRQNPEPLENLISNYNELKKEFSGTEWASFFA